MVASSTSAKKAKGQTLQKLVRDMLLNNSCGLTLDDVRSTSSGVKGVDIMLSQAAKAQYPFAIECKFQESWSVPDWWRQALTNGALEKLEPLLVIKRSRTNPLVVVDAAFFFKHFRRT